MTLSNYTVAKRFANRKDKGTAKNMYIWGNTIYSYGHHFPIARWLDEDTVVFTTNEYSMTTAGHKSAVLRALRSEGIKVIFTKGCNTDIYTIREQIKENTREIEKAKEKLSRARVEHMKYYWKSRIQELKEQNKLLRERFAIEAIISL